MKENLVKFFIRRHLLTNLIFISVLIAGIFSWKTIPKEELPDVTFDFVRISVSYPGATAEEVEYFVTKPIEEAVRDLDGIYRVTSSTGVGNCSVTAEIENDYENKDEVVTEIRNEVLSVDLPEDIIDDPSVRVFKTSRKAIIDIGFIDKKKNILDVKSRQRLQTYALALENQLLSMPEINSVSRSGYLKDEIQIKVLPDKLKQYNIPFNTVMSEIRNNNVRQPAGSIENVQEPKVTLSAELDTVEKLKDLSIQGGFEGNIIRLKDVAEVDEGHEKTKVITKINGHEGIFLNARKNSKSGILDAVDAVERSVETFRKTTLKGTDIDVILLDDESVDVRNRLRLVGINGLIGFILILVILFLFLDFESGVWVAAGIPFTFAFTLIGALLIGYSINNVTLAAVIIVMGMVVDDAIVVAENINRNRMEGMSLHESAVSGTSFVLLPVIASILTTCVAFVPLFFFAGRFGVMVKVIPLVIFLMLGGSLLEAIFILPGHMILSFVDKIKRVLPHGKITAGIGDKKPAPKGRAYFLALMENAYESAMNRLLKMKWIVFIFFIFLITFSWSIAKNNMKFVMFPDEETRQIRVTGETTPGTKRHGTSKITQGIEDAIAANIGKEVIGFRNEIGRSHWGSAAQENKFSMRVEVLPKEKRKLSADDLIALWTEKTRDIPGLKKIQFGKTRHGQSSGTPIEILVKENNNERRTLISDRLAEALRKYPALENIEIDRPVYNPEYKLTLDRDKIRRLAINPSDISRTLRSALEGSILYEFEGDDEPVYVRLTTVNEAKDDIEKIFSIPVENQGQYLVPLGDVVFMEEIHVPDAINREDSKRVTKVYASIKESSGKTPLDIAEYFETNVFPKFKEDFPSAVLEFRGEVMDTRESGKDFGSAIIMALLFIYFIMALLLDSLIKPLMIMLAIPFGIAGVVLAFWEHGIVFYGFFTLIGCIGLAGVVVNDAIIMVVKLDNDFDDSAGQTVRDSQIAGIAKTRLRAVMLTTITTVAGIIPTAYGWAGYDGMLAQMMLAIAWGLLFGTLVTLVFVPCVYSVYKTVTLSVIKR